MPKISVIIPAYNAEAFLDECFASLATQSFRDFEAIVVDDGSTDNTGALCDTWASSCPHVTVLHKENEGRLLARRDAMAVARGEYVMFLDADDALREDALLRVADAIADTGAEVVAFGFSKNPDYSHPKFCKDFPLNAPVGQGGGLARRAALKGRVI